MMFPPSRSIPDVLIIKHRKCRVAEGDAEQKKIGVIHMGIYR